MNVGIITNVGTKGQIVIPSKMRKTLGLEPGVPVSVNLVGESIYVQPVSVTPKVAEDNSVYLEILKKVQGSWGPETEEEKKMERKRKKLELAAAKRSRNAW